MSATTVNATTTERAKDYGIAAIRVMVGVVFLAHGLMKLTGFGVTGTAGFFAQQGIPLPLLSAVLAIGAETLGGIALILGLGTRLVAAPLAFTMLVAVVSVHLSGGFFSPNGFEYPLTLLVASAGLGLTGSGAFALESALFRAPSRNTFDSPAAQRLA
jgi:putative oxidoreductase